MDTAAIIRRAAEIIALPGFDRPGFWLTFCLCADPAPLYNAGRRIADLGGTNLDDAEGGFLYPKLPVQRNPSAIVTLVQQVYDLASACKVEVLGVDVDTSLDVEASSFKKLL